MKITDLKYEKLNLKLKKPIITSLVVIEEYTTIITRIDTNEGIYGYGEASPLDMVTGETVDSVIDFYKNIKNLVIGKNPIEIFKIMNSLNDFSQKDTSAKAGIDIALHDILGKKLNMPLWKVLGGYKEQFKSDKTIAIGSIEEMKNEALDLKTKGFDALKIKAGINVEEDIEVVRQIRNAVGDDMKLRIDANQSWNKDDAIHFINEVSNCNVQLVEQPVRKDLVCDLAEIKKQSNIPIMGDETIFNSQDAFRALEAKAIDAVNIKLMKSAGISEALRINNVAAAAGAECMVGCMIESKVGISASAHLIASQKNIVHADIDSLYHIEDDGIDSTMNLTQPNVVMNYEAGLGLRYIY